ncbi:hypothetical protein Bca101_097221 [Brassica carinata]
MESWSPELICCSNASLHFHQCGVGESPMVDEQSYQNKIPKVYICQALNPSVVNSSILLVDLKAGCGSNTAEVPLLIFREAKNVKKGGQLTGVHMLLLKEKKKSCNPGDVNEYKSMEAKITKQKLDFGKFSL